MKYQGTYIHLKMTFPGTATWTRQILVGFCLTGLWFFCIPGFEQGSWGNKKTLTLIHAGLVKDFSFLKCFSVPLIWSLQHTWGRNHYHEIFTEIPEDSGLWIVGCNYCQTRELFMLLMKSVRRKELQTACPAPFGVSTQSPLAKTKFLVGTGCSHKMGVVRDVEIKGPERKKSQSTLLCKFFSLSDVPWATSEISTGPWGGEQLIPTFEDDLQLVPQDVKDAVSGAGLWDHMPVQPAPTGILVEILARVSCGVHVLDDSGSWAAKLESWILQPAQEPLGLLKTLKELLGKTYSHILWLEESYFLLRDGSEWQMQNAGLNGRRGVPEPCREECPVLLWLQFRHCPRNPCSQGAIGNVCAGISPLLRCRYHK